MPNAQERLQILDRLERGEITTQAAADLLAGLQPTPAPADSPMTVLGQLERGEISPEEAAQRLQAPPPAEQVSASAEPVEVIDPAPQQAHKTPIWWVFGIGTGVLLAVSAGLWMRNDLLDGRLGLGFACAWLPMALGLLLIVLGAAARNSPWASIRIRSKKHGAHSQRAIDLDVPLPVGLASQAIRFASHRVAGLDLHDAEDLLKVIEDAKTRGKPIVIQAHDDDDNESVDIRIS